MANKNDNLWKFIRAASHSFALIKFAQSAHQWAWDRRLAVVETWEQTRELRELDVNSANRLGTWCQKEEGRRRWRRRRGKERRRRSRKKICRRVCCCLSPGTISFCCFSCNFLSVVELSGRWENGYGSN